MTASRPTAAARARGASTSTPIKPGVLLVGRNGVCTDAIGTAVMGFDPMARHWQHPFPGDNHLLLLAQMGVGAVDPKRIEVRGLPVKEAVFPYNPKRQPRGELEASHYPPLRCRGRDSPCRAGHQCPNRAPLARWVPLLACPAVPETRLGKPTVAPVNSGRLGH